MLLQKLAIVVALATAATAQVGNIFCQARYITNVATCVIGVKECNAVERFSQCVCENTGHKDRLQNCVSALLRDPSFEGVKTCVSVFYVGSRIFVDRSRETAQAGRTNIECGMKGTR